MESSKIKQLALISLIITESGRVSGRTKFQKMAYLVDLSQWRAFNDFKYHNYGPFSETLSNQIGSMVGNGWIREESSVTGRSRSYYSYTAEKGMLRRLQSILSRVRDQDPSLVQRTQGLVRQLNRFPSDDLEIMATLAFLHKSEDLNGEALVERVSLLKERFSEDRIRKNLRIFRILRPFGAFGN